MNTEISNTNSKRAIYIVLILLLLLINGILFYSNQSLKKDTKETIGVLENEKLSLQNNYDSVLEDLDTYKVENLQLDSALTDLQAQIEDKKLEIERILRKSKASKGELQKADILIQSLQTDAFDYREKITALEFHNKKLTEENTSLQQTVVQKIETIEIVTTEKNELEESLTAQIKEVTAEKEILGEEKEQLTEKVDRASIMQVINVIGGGVQYKKKGTKEVKTDVYKKTDKIKVCFDLLENPIVPAGQQDIFLRILGPKGDVLSIEAMGSGNLVLTESEVEIKYTMVSAIPYKQKTSNYCIYWEQNTPFQVGSYIVELYHAGYKIGSDEFRLKKGGIF